MTLPMVLTTGRIALAPVFALVYFLAGRGSALVYAVWLIFILIEASDLLDGFFARKLGQVSEIGKVLDPFADSISRITYFICFAWSGFLPIWILLVLVYRDIVVAYLRILVSKRGVMMSSRLSGKLKAWVYGVGGGAGVLLFALQKMDWAVFWREPLERAAIYFFLAVAAVAVWSAVDYVFSVKNSIKMVLTNK
jgi:CDP-diacylglycerol--glycerol-3-phosphate 3-phosphatidyltransferase